MEKRDTESSDPLAQQLDEANRRIATLETARLQAETLFEVTQVLGKTLTPQATIEAILAQLQECKTDVGADDCLVVRLPAPLRSTAVANAGHTRIGRLAAPDRGPSLPVLHLALPARVTPGSERLGWHRAVRAVDRARRMVPAYRAFLAEHDADLIDCVQLTVPPMDKHNYINEYSIEDRCVRGVLPHTATMIDESSREHRNPS